MALPLAPVPAEVPMVVLLVLVLVLEMAVIAHKLALTARGVLQVSPRFPSLPANASPSLSPCRAAFCASFPHHETGLLDLATSQFLLQDGPARCNPLPSTLAISSNTLCSASLLYHLAPSHILSALKSLTYHAISAPIARRVLLPDPQLTFG